MIAAKLQCALKIGPCSVAKYHDVIDVLMLFVLGERNGHHACIVAQAPDRPKR